MEQTEIRVIEKHSAGHREEETERYHPFHEIFYILEGACSVFIGQRVGKLTAGDFAVIPAGTLHRTDYIGEAENSKLVISFSRSVVRKIEQFMGQPLDEVLRPGWITAPLHRREALGTQLSRMLAEYENHLPCADGVCRAMLAELLLILVRYRRLADEPDITTDETVKRTHAIIAYLCEHLEEALTLEGIAKQFALSPSWLSHSFKEQTGFGLREYLSHLRVQHAQELLMGTDLPVTEIATRCGYSDSNYFGDAFKKITGVSPRTYRKQQGAEEGKEPLYRFVSSQK